jgi:hypothetical protein
MNLIDPGVTPKNFVNHPVTSILKRLPQLCLNKTVVLLLLIHYPYYFYFARW